jgi:hypothetical protein
LCTVAVLLTLGATQTALAQDTTPGEHLGGYDVQASAMAVSIQPVFPAFLPTGDAPLEGTLALSTGRVKSGGNAFGRGAIVWPGNAAGDPGPLFGQLVGPEVGGLFPKWPLQAQADQEDGEVTTGAPPGISMKAVGFPDHALGDVRIADANAPGLVHVEHIASTADTVVTDSAVSSVARVTLQGVAIANGFITVEEIRSLSRTTGNGSTSATAGDVDIVGMKIGGIDVSVTDDGFQVTGVPPEGADAPGAGGEPFPGQSPEEQVQQVLENLNARITLFEGVGRTRGGQAQHYELGIVFSIDNPVGGQGPIPPGRFDIILGSTSSSTLSSSPFSASTSTGGLGSTGSTGSSGGSTTGGSVSIGSGPSVGGGTVGEVSGGLSQAPSAPSTGSLDGRPAGYRFNGIPMGLLIGLLVAALVAARFIRNFFNSIMMAQGGMQ